MTIGKIARSLCAVAALLAALAAVPVRAQSPGRAQAPEGSLAAGVFVPDFWDPQRRMERPDTSGLRIIRFVTDDEYPPFGFIGADGALTGFNVDLARAICEELKVVCTIQARRFDTIEDALVKGEADAAAASFAITAASRAQLDFTRPYYRTPGRFVARRDFELRDIRPATLAGRTVGVVAGSAHAAFLEKFFPATERKEYPTLPAMLAALRGGASDIAFADGVTLAIWLNGSDSQNCCTFRGGPYLTPQFFGYGVGIAVRRGNVELRQALDYALARLARRGVYTELYLKYFPIGFF